MEGVNVRLALAAAGNLQQSMRFHLFDGPRNSRLGRANFRAHAYLTWINAVVMPRIGKQFGIDDFGGKREIWIVQDTIGHLGKAASRYRVKTGLDSLSIAESVTSKSSATQVVR